MMIAGLLTRFKQGVRILKPSLDNMQILKELESYSKQDFEDIL